MVIELNKLKASGKEESPFSFAFKPDGEIIGLPNARFADAAIIEGICEVYPNKAFLSGTLTFAVEGECSRCLAPAKRVVEVGFDEEYRPAPCDDENVNVYYKDVLDVGALAKELILTNMPYVIYCKDDCKGLCPTCGKNLNEGECGCNKN